MATFTEVTVEEWPASITTLVEVVASHQHLRRKNWNLFTVFQFQSLLCNLGEAHSVAGTTVLLVSVEVGEVNSLHVSPVKVFRQLTVRDFVCTRILLELSCLSQNLREILLFAKRSTLIVLFFKSITNLRQIGGLAVRSVVSVMLLILASVCLPSEVK
jgi:hypothetical protein